MMSIQRFTESELLKDLNTTTNHAEELAELLPQELTSLEKLKGSVLRYDRPLDPVWNDDVNPNECVPDDPMKCRDQPETDS